MVCSAWLAIMRRVQGYKPALLRERQLKQLRKQDLVIQRWNVASPLLIGQKVLRG